MSKTFTQALRELAGYKYPVAKTEKTYNTSSMLPPLDYPINDDVVPGMDFNYDFGTTNDKWRYPLIRN